MDGFERSLYRLGVGPETLTPAETVALDTAGWVVLNGVIPATELPAMRAAFDEASETQTASGTRHIDDLLACGTAFEGLLLHPRVLACAWHVLQRPFITRRIHGRDPLPGYGQQGLHADWFQPAANNRFDVATAIGMLDDFTDDSGSTRLIPGSHLWRSQPGRKTGDPAFHHPDEVVIIEKAGSVLFFNGHVLHSATRNRSRSSRRSLQMCFYGGEYRSMPGLAYSCSTTQNPGLRTILGIADGDGTAERD